MKWKWWSSWDGGPENRDRRACWDWDSASAVRPCTHCDPCSDSPGSFGLAVGRSIPARRSLPVESFSRSTTNGWPSRRRTSSASRGRNPNPSARTAKYHQNQHWLVLRHWFDEYEPTQFTCWNHSFFFSNRKLRNYQWHDWH